MNPSQLNGKLFAVVLGDAQGSTFRGTARWNGDILVIDCGEDKPPFQVREEWYGRIQRVEGPVAKAILEGAEFWLRVQVPDE
jgi:hypothetical protein